MREAHLRDAVALCDFFAFLEDTIAAGGKLTEVQVKECYAGFRGARSLNRAGHGYFTPS